MANTKETKRLETWFIAGILALMFIILTTIGTCSYLLTKVSDSVEIKITKKADTTQSINDSIVKQ